MTFLSKGQGPKFPRQSKYKQVRRSLLVCVILILVMVFLYTGITKTLNNDVESLSAIEASSSKAAFIQQETKQAHGSHVPLSKEHENGKTQTVTPQSQKEKAHPSSDLALIKDPKERSLLPAAKSFNPALPRMLAEKGLPPVYAAESTAWCQPFVGFGTEEISAILVEKYGKLKPKEWGEKITGVVTKVHKGSSPVVVLTLDACDGKKDKSYDAKLIEFLKENNIPATLFISSQWISNNRQIFSQLSLSPLFEIAGHGVTHKPLSTDGKSAYGVKGTSSIQGIVEEVEANTREIHRLTTKRPKWFRSGTGYYDDISINIVHDLDLHVAGYSFSADQGATLSAKSVEKNMLSAKNGDIIIAHMNHPESGTREGIIDAIPILLKRGYVFKTLSDAFFSKE